MLLLQLYLMYPVIQSRWKTFFKNKKTFSLFHTFIICFYKDFCIYWNQSEIIKNHKELSLVDKF